MAQVSQRKLYLTAGVLFLLMCVLFFCVWQIAHSGANAAMLLEIALTVIGSGIVVITLGYLGANVLDKAKGVIDAVKGNKTTPGGITGEGEK
jgi:heme/copper-type cytochrome/quinol oxidase subunit 2